MVSELPVGRTCPRQDGVSGRADGKAACVYLPPEREFVADRSRDRAAGDNRAGDVHIPRNPQRIAVRGVAAEGERRNCNFTGSSQRS